MKKLLTLLLFILLFIPQLTFSQISNWYIHITDDTTWSGNVTLHGDVYIDSAVTLTVLPDTFVHIDGYYAIYSHGTIRAEGTADSNIIFTRLNTMNHNDTSTVDGGWHGIRLLPRSTNDTSIFKYCRIVNGKAVVPGWYSLVNNYPDNRGANLYAVDFGSLIIKNCFIGNGISRGDGGGIYLENGNFVLIDSSHFTDNRCYYVLGGGACIRYVDTLIITNNLFNYNIAYYMFQGWSSGGGAAFSISNALDMEAQAYIFNNKLLNNTASGSILYDAYYNARVSNNLICSNYGSGIYNAHFFNAPVYSNNTIAYNSGYMWSGALTLSPDLILINNIFWNNLIYPGYIEPQIYWFPSGTPPTVLYSDVMLGYDGTGNMDTDPLFVNPPPEAGGSYNALDYDWSLRDDSPLINAGVPDTTGWNIPPTDFVGNPRIYGIRIDMGAIENQNVMVSLTEKDAFSHSIFLYPNPGRYIVKVHMPVNSNHVTIYLTDVSGRIILSQQVEDQKEIDISSLTSGIYIYRIIVNGTTLKTGKWIKR